MVQPRVLQSPTQLSVLIKTTRQSLGLSQADVAARLGISQNRYSELERHAGTLTAERLLDLARVLELELVIQPRGRVAQDTPKSAW